MTDQDQYIRPTTDFWQTLLSDADFGPGSEFSLSPPYRYGYPARLPDGRYLVLPIRRIKDQSSMGDRSMVTAAPWQ